MTSCAEASRSSGWARSRSRKKRRPSWTSWRSDGPMRASGGDYSEADRLRQEIEAQGWEVRDVAGDSGYRLVPKR